MGKEIKFKSELPGGKTLVGRQDGVTYRILYDKKKGETCAPAYSVMTHDAKDKGRTIRTTGHLYFHLDGAKAFCQEIADGKADLISLQVQFKAEDEAKEMAAVQAAAERAKQFREKLNRYGITFTTLLGLTAECEQLDDLARNILLGMERGEGLPNG